MQKNILLTISLFFISLFAEAQLANWSAVLPTKFPTNASGQIHGISRVSQIKFHPTSATKMYAVSARGGLFVSTDAGANWTVAPGTDFMAYARLASVCVDYTNDQIIYLGTGDHNYYYNGNGVMKSTNGGQTFTQTSLTGKLVVDMVMDPTNHNIIVAITNQGIYKTTDAGSTWVLKTASRPFDEIKQKTLVSRVLYSCTTDSAFFRSTDFGDTWSQITNGIVLPAGTTNGNGCRIAVTPADSNVVYLGMVVNGGTIYKSTDGGSTFVAKKNTVSPYLTYYANLNTSSSQGDYNFGIGVDRTNANIVYLVAHNNWKSTDGGLTWTLLTNWYEKCHTDMHQIVTSPYNNNNLYNVNDGGIFLSTDGGSNWTPKSDGIYGYEIYHGNCSPTRKDIISIGTQDNGELYSNTLGWYTNRGGDWGSQCAFDYRPSSYMVYYYQNNQRRLVNGGNSTYGLPNQVTLLHDIAFHRSNPNLAFVADSFIYRTNDLTATGPTWTQIASLGKKIMAMQVSFADTNRLYIITSDNTFYVSANALSATPTFTSYTLPSTSNNRASITTIKSNPAVVYITINTQVYRSANYGATWTNITYNLPSVNHVKIIADEYYSGNELVFIASNNAVYYKVGTATAWTIYNTNLPTRTEAIDLSIFNDSTSNSVLRYASYGRGMWETPISNLRTINANFIANQLNPCLGEAVTFSDLSTGNIASRTWSFPGGTPSTSTAVSPVVTYATNGIYSATLTISDGVTNSTLTLPNYINTNGATIPLAEGFEGSIDPPSGWKNIDNGTVGYTWAKTSAAGGFGNSTNAMMFDNYSWNVVGEKDELVTTKLNLVGLTSAAMTFDLAYQIFTGYSDSLNVLVSTDCGATYTNVYAKDANGLTTAGSGGNNFVPTASQWRTESINLNAFVGQQILIKFQNVNGYGNKLYIDNVNIFSPPTAIFTATPLSICQGSTVTFTNTSTGSASSYLWSFPGGTPATSTATNPVVTYPISGVYNVSLTATNAAGSNTSTQTNYVTVNSSILPSVNISVTYFIICAGTSVTFTATPTNGGSTPSYQWKVNGTNVGTNSSTYSTSTLSNGQIVTCVMTSSDACASPATATSNSIIMTVNQPTSSNLSVSACSSYSWSCNATTYTTSGNYTCTSLNANNCTHTTTLNLTVNANTSSSQTVTATSATYTWSVNNVTYTSSGTYTSTSLNAAGCTHTSTLILTIPANNYNCYVKNFSQPSASQMEFDIWIEWTGTNTAKLQSFQAGIDFNHAGMSNGGPSTMTGSFIAGTADPSLLPPQNAPTVSINATSKQFRIAAAIATTAAGAQTIPPPNGFRLGRFRIDNGGIPFTTNSTSNMVWFFGTASSTKTKTTVICYLNGASSGTTVTINANHTIVNPIVLNPPGPSLSVLSNGSGAATVCSPATANIKVTITGGTSPYTIVYTDGTNNFTVNNYISGTDIPATQTGTYSLVSVTATGGGTGLNLNSGTATVNINTCTATLNLKCHMQGYYLGANSMTNVLYNEAMEANPSTNVDTITVELRNAATPHNLEGTYKGILQSNGTITCTYPGTVITKSCYVVVHHRNTIETWSSNPFTVAATNMYDFTTAANKAYGNNEIDVMNENIWSMYNGDINQDGAIDANDYLLLDVDMQGFASGYYASDINGDGTVDSSDFLILDANIQGFISSSTP